MDVPLAGLSDKEIVSLIGFWHHATELNLGKAPERMWHAQSLSSEEETLPADPLLWLNRVAVQAVASACYDSTLSRSPCVPESKGPEGVRTRLINKHDVLVGLCAAGREKHRNFCRAPYITAAGVHGTLAMARSFIAAQRPLVADNLPRRFTTLLRARPND